MGTNDRSNDYFFEGIKYLCFALYFDQVALAAVKGWLRQRLPLNK